MAMIGFAVLLLLETDDPAASLQPDEELPDLVVRSLKVKDGGGEVRAYLTTRAA
jgi:hypothetical protein